MFNLNILIIWNLILKLTFYRNLSNYQTIWNKFLKNILNFFLKKYPILSSEQSIFQLSKSNIPASVTTCILPWGWDYIEERSPRQNSKHVFWFSEVAHAHKIWRKKKGNRKLFTAERKRKVKQSFHGNFPKRLIESSDFCRTFKSI